MNGIHWFFSLFTFSLNNPVSSDYIDLINNSSQLVTLYAESAYSAVLNYNPTQVKSTKFFELLVNIAIGEISVFLTYFCTQISWYPSNVWIPISVIHVTRIRPHPTPILRLITVTNPDFISKGFCKSWEKLEIKKD